MNDMPPRKPRRASDIMLQVLVRSNGATMSTRRDLDPVLEIQALVAAMQIIVRSAAELLDMATEPAEKNSDDRE
jgi:hypothetical protein